MIRGKSNLHTKKYDACMSKKHKHKRKPFYASVLVLAALGLGGMSLAAQVRADLSGRTAEHARVTAITLAGASPVSTGPAVAKVSTPSPKPSALPTRIPVPVVAKPSTPKPVPVVKPVPNSSVNNLVPVAQTPAPTTTPSPTPGSSPGPSASPSPPVYAYTSSNWSGYLASAGTFSGVSGSWTVPDPSGNGHSTSADATWVGIGGVTSADLIQVGTTDAVSRSGQASSEAFYEMLPAASTPVPGMTVAPGDAVSAGLTQLSAGQWRISITDATRNESFNLTVSYDSSNSTAEWIEEDPSYSAGHQIPFDDFGSVSFSGATAVENGSSQTLAGAGAQAILMQIGGHTVATPSGISGNGDGFTVTGGS
jgi:peptidase A4-like protein